MQAKWRGPFVLLNNQYELVGSLPVLVLLVVNIESAWSGRTSSMYSIERAKTKAVTQSATATELFNHDHLKLLILKTAVYP